MKNLTTLILLVFTTLAWSVDQVTLSTALQIQNDRDRRIALNDLIHNRNSAQLSEANIDLLVTHLNTENDALIIRNIVEEFADQNQSEAIERVYSQHVNLSRPTRKASNILRGLSDGDENEASRRILERVVDYNIRNNFPANHREINWHALDYLVDNKENGNAQELEAQLIANLSSRNTYSLSRRDALDELIDMNQPRHADLIIAQLGNESHSAQTEDIAEFIQSHGNEAQQTRAENAIIEIFNSRASSNLEVEYALEGLLVFDNPENTEYLISNLSNRSLRSNAEDIVTQILRHGNDDQISRTERVLRESINSDSDLELQYAVKALMVMDKPEHTDILISVILTKDLGTLTDDVIEQIGKHGSRAHLASLVDFLGSDSRYDRLAALRSIQEIMERELTQEQIQRVRACLPNVNVEPYSEDTRAIGLLVDIVFTMGLTTAAMWDGREVTEPLDQETINAMKSFFESILS